jgi:hypothetical protein
VRIQDDNRQEKTSKQGVNDENDDALSYLEVKTMNENRCYLWSDGFIKSSHKKIIAQLLHAVVGSFPTSSLTSSGFFF